MIITFYKRGKFFKYQRFFPDEKARAKYRKKLTRSGCQNINLMYALY